MNAPSRSDSDVLLKELRLVFGGKEYVVPVLRMRESAKWREEFAKRIKQVSDAMGANMVVDEKSPDASKMLGNSILRALLDFPEAIPDLVFSYAASLQEKREEIMDAAYDQEFMLAFKQIWGVAFAPFLSSLGMTIEMERAQESRSASLPRVN